MNGVIAECPAGSRSLSESTEACLPEGFNINSWADLEGLGCESSELVCETNPESLNCYCGSDEKGALRWFCAVNAR
jgi:hypothetical protein